MGGVIWNSLLKQNEKIIMLTQEILQEVRKRPASERDVMPAQSKTKGRGKACGLFCEFCHLWVLFISLTLYLLFVEYCKASPSHSFEKN